MRWFKKLKQSPELFTTFPQNPIKKYELNIPKTYLENSRKCQTSTLSYLPCFDRILSHFTPEVPWLREAKWLFGMLWKGKWKWLCGVDWGNSQLNYLRNPYSWTCTKLFFKYSRPGWVGVTQIGSMELWLHSWSQHSLISWLVWWP